jgi:hypothetical protein
LILQFNCVAGVPVLGDVPISLSIREAGDTGLPVAVARPQGPEVSGDSL